MQNRRELLTLALGGATALIPGVTSAAVTVSQPPRRDVSFVIGNCKYIILKSEIVDGALMILEHRVENPDGSRNWYKGYEPHREDGPAMEFANGDKYWYWRGKLHREDGPAMEFANGDKHWYWDGVRYLPPTR